MQSPLVSAIIPVYNGELYLREALDSVFAQSYPNLEVILVDDGSTDRTPEIAASYPGLIYIRQENQKDAAARIRGIEAARGSFIAFLDHDDRWALDKIERQIAAFSQNPSLQYAIGQVELFVDPACPPSFAVRKILLEKPHSGYLPGTLMARKELMDRFPINPDYPGATDMDWFFRVREANIPFSNLPHTLLYRRIHGENMSVDQMGQYRNLLSIIKDSVSRKKALNLSFPKKDLEADDVND